MGNINAVQDSSCIIWINIGDEFCVHLQPVVLSCPVFQGNVNCSWTKIGSADTDLHYSRELFPGSVGDFAIVNLLGKSSNSLLLFYIEITLVYAIGNDIFSSLASAELVKYQSLFTGIDHFAVVECFEFCA